MGDMPLATKALVLVITDFNAIPAKFFIAESEVKLDRKKLWKALRAGYLVEGCHLERRPRTLIEGDRSGGRESGKAKEPDQRGLCKSTEDV